MYFFLIYVVSGDKLSVGNSCVSREKCDGKRMFVGKRSVGKSSISRNFLPIDCSSPMVAFADR